MSDRAGIDRSSDSADAGPSFSHVPAEPAASPAGRLYPVLLHCVFSFCSLVDLASILSTCHCWFDAVRSFPPLSLWLRQRCAITPVLGRHVARMQAMIVDTAMLSHTLRWCTNLEHLICAARPEIAEGGLQWPQRLRTLRFIVPRSISVDRINELLLSISALRFLETLSLTFPAAYSQIRFACFASQSSLRSLNIEWDADADYGHLFPEQIEDVRSLSVTEFNLDSISAGILASILKPPVSLPWTELYLPSTCVLDERAAHLLRSLPALTAMRVQGISRDRFFDFLHFTPQLLSIAWQRLKDMGSQVPEMFLALHQCSKLTRLYLCASAVVDSPMLRQLLTQLPELRVLRLCELSELSHLNFLSAAPALEEFDLLECSRVPAADLSVLFSLQSLRNLCIEDCFELGEEERATWTLPVARLPKLKEFTFWPNPWQ